MPVRDLVKIRQEFGELRVIYPDTQSSDTLTRRNVVNLFLLFTPGDFLCKKD